KANPTAAEDHLRRAVQLDASLDDAWLRLAAILESQNADRQREAAEIYRKLLETHPGQKDVRLHFGEFQLTQKNYFAAAEQFEAARAAGDASLPLAKDLLQAYLGMLEANGGLTPREKLQTRLADPQSINPNASKETEKQRQKAL